MKTTLEFILPDERPELDLALKAGNYYGALHDLSMYFRSRRKHEEMTPARAKAFDEIRDRFIEILRENEIQDF